MTDKVLYAEVVTPQTVVTQLTSGVYLTQCGMNVILENWDGKFWYGRKEHPKDANESNFIGVYDKSGNLVGVVDKEFNAQITDKDYMLIKRLNTSFAYQLERMRHAGRIQEENKE